MDIRNLEKLIPFTTKDGSEIRELLAWRNSCIRNQSLAEARLAIGSSTQEHFHIKTEEIYYITHGTGRLRIEDESKRWNREMPSRSLQARSTSFGIPVQNPCASCAVAHLPTNMMTLS